MDIWTKIKQNIYAEKLNEVDNLFDSLKSRSSWSANLQSWAYKQRTDKYESLGLSLSEYNEVKTNFKELNEGREEFKRYYKILLDQKEENLKLEVVAELVEDKKVPLDIFTEWYLENKHLDPQQFQETLGEFWGDVWKGAKRGAAAGALGGAAAGTLGGAAGTFAGAGIGGLAGGIGGGIYGAGKHIFGSKDNSDGNYDGGGSWRGAGKHLLNKVWDWRKNHVEFEKTKKEAYEILKKLKLHADKFELDPNFVQLLDTMLQKLGGVKAYKLKQPEQPAQQVQQSTQAQPTAQEPQTTGNSFQVSAPTGGTQSVASPPTNIMHQGNTGTIPGSHIADVGTGVGMHDLPGGGKPERKKRNKKPLETEPQPTAVDIEEEKPINSKEDVIAYLHKPGLDEKELNNRLVKLGLALNIIGDPDDYKDIDFELLRHGLMHDVSNIPNEEKEHYREKALAYQNYLAKSSAVPAEPENKPIPNQPAKQYVAEEDPASMPKPKFKEYLKSKGMWQDDMLSHIGGSGSDKRLQFIADNGVTESLVNKYKALLKQDARPVFVEHKIGSLTFQDRIHFYKEALRGRL
jgi:hypothetical protein